MSGMDPRLLAVQRLSARRAQELRLRSRWRWSALRPARPRPPPTTSTPNMTSPNASQPWPGPKPSVARTKCMLVPSGPLAVVGHSAGQSARSRRFSQPIPCERAHRRSHRLRSAAMRKLWLVLVLLALVGAGACGDKDKDKEGGEALDTAACAAASAAAGSVSLPSGFPAESDVTFTATVTAGPTSITTGTSSDSLKTVFERFKADLAKSPYSVTKSEKDDHDAEVNFAGPDSTGQVKLRDC